MVFSGVVNGFGLLEGVGFACLPLCGGEVEVEMWVVRPFQKGSLGLSF